MAISTMQPGLRVPAPWAVACAAILAACGGGDAGPEAIPDDDPLARSAPSGRRGDSSAAQQRQARQAASGQRGAFASYEKVSEDLRRELSDREFRPDPSGTTNRDPFRSYVIAQAGLTTGGLREEARDRTEICDESNSVATDYSLRDLTLIGIVLRGTRSYAMFRDRAGLGYIVNRGECLGSEQAVIRRIGSGFVQLETISAPTTGATGATAQQREILLYPEEFDLPPGEELE